MASCPITSWQIDGETVETVADFILGGFKITADGDFGHDINRLLLLGRKFVANLDSILKRWRKNAAVSSKRGLYGSADRKAAGRQGQDHP